MERRDATRAALAALALALTAAAAAAAPLSLADAVGRAMREAAPVKVAQQRFDTQLAQLGVARAPLLPGVYGSASQRQYTFNLESYGLPTSPGLGPRMGPIDGFDARFTVTQALLDVSAHRRLAAAHSGLYASSCDVSAVQQVVGEGAALRYVAAERAAATVAARRADLALAQELDSLAVVALRAGTAANIDVLRAHTQLAAARGDLSVAGNALERARIDLARALGGEPEERFELADSLGRVPASDAPDTREAAVALALQSRSEIEAEGARLARASAERGAVAAERLPRIDAEADWGANGLLPDDAIATRQVAIRASVPLFDGARRESRMRQQSAAMRESEINAKELSRQVTAEVEGALLDVASGGEQEGIARERVALALQQVSEARLRLKSGVAGNIDVIEAQSALVRARDAEIAARAATAVALVRLARATGVVHTLR